MRSVVLASVVIVVASALSAQENPAEPIQTVLPATQLDLDAARAAALDQELARARAEIVGLRADVAVCQANTEQAKRELQSVMLTNDVEKTVRELERVHPGSHWIWDNDKRRIVQLLPPPVTPTAKEPSK